MPGGIDKKNSQSAIDRTESADRFVSRERNTSALGSAQLSTTSVRNRFSGNDENSSNASAHFIIPREGKIIENKYQLRFYKEEQDRASLEGLLQERRSQHSLEQATDRERVCVENKKRKASED